MMHPRAKAVLDYWFGDLEQTPEYFKKRMPFWFFGGEKVDAYIRRHFEKDVIKAARGGYKAWERSPREALALIVLLDQFSLNLYREQPRSYDQSKLALPIADRMIQKRLHLLLTPIERAFVYLPYEHGESMKHQTKSVRLFSELHRQSPAYAKAQFAGMLDYAKRHSRVVREFGRFPDRNDVYGRESSPRELRFLASPRAPF
jgi:uncharacterized protein (DUF924 family)